MNIIAIANHKGGVGKTTTTVNLGAGLTRLGKKVLLIDLDSQAQLTNSLGIQPQQLNKTIYNLLKSEVAYNDVIIEKNNIHLIPSNLNLSGAEIEFSSVAGREYILKESLNGLNGYDYVLFDCPPSLGLLTLNALTTSNEIYVPIQTEYLALQGMSKLLKAVDVVKKRLNHDIEITGIIATRYDKRKKLNNEVVKKLNQHFGNKLFKTYIRENISIAEAPSFGKSIFEYRPDCNGAMDYLNLSKEIIINKEKGNGQR